jgi:peptide/nickel transport system substrate-binding protein
MPIARPLPAPIAQRTLSFPTRRWCGVAATALGALLAGCGHGDASGGRGTVVIASAADADFLFPPLTSTAAGKAIEEQIFEPLADVGDSLNVIGDAGFVPRLADSWTWAPDSLSIAFHLNPRARWQDGVPVTARDVRFTYRVYTDSALASPAATLVADVDSVTVRDSLTPVVWLHRRMPDAFTVAATEMRILPEHVYGSVAPAALRTSPLMRQPVGSGRFRLARWVPGSTIELVSNAAHYRAPARLDRVIWTISPDYPAASMRLLAGEADFLENVRSSLIPKVAAAPSIALHVFPGFHYGYLAFNLHDPKHPSAPHPLFGDRALRRALTMAVDRRAIVKNVYDTLAAPSIGPMVRAMPTTDTAVAQIPFDPAAAARTLDSLGWRLRGADTVRTRNGVPLAFTIMTPASSQDRARQAVLIQAQLRRVGVAVTVQSLEINAFMRQQATRGFDAAMEYWLLDPNPSEVRESWSSAAAATKGGSNYSGYASATFDAQLDSASRAPTLAAARPLFAHALQTIVNDAPAIWLAEPENVAAAQRRVHVTLRPDSWWAHLADWWIPANERIARDRVPAGVPATASATASSGASAAAPAAQGH